MLQLPPRCYQGQAAIGARDHSCDLTRSMLGPPHRLHTCTITATGPAFPQVRRSSGLLLSLAGISDPKEFKKRVLKKESTVRGVNAPLHRRAPLLRAFVCKRLLGLSRFMYSPCLLPAAPVAGPASVVGKRDHPELFATDVVDDTKRKTNLGIGFASVEDSAFG